MSLTAQTIRYVAEIDALPRYTGAILMPMNTPLNAPYFAAVPGDLYPSSRVVRRTFLPFDPLANINRTWIARPGGSSVGEDIPNSLQFTTDIYGQAVATICDPDLVDWASITRTGNRPKNLQCGRLQYDRSLGPVNLVDVGPTLVATDTAYETRQPLRVDNALVEANKLAPYIAHADIDAIGYRGVWTSRNFFPTIFAAVRHLNGPADDVYRSASILVTNSSVSGANEIFVSPIDPITMEADYAAAVSMGIVAPSSTMEISRTDLEAAGVVRWDQYFIWPSAPAEILAEFYSPVDIPPVYNCAGVDGLLPGGFYS